MRKFTKTFAVAAVFAISLAAPSIGFAHSMGAFPSGQWGSTGSWTGHGGMGRGTMSMDMGPGMMQMMGVGPGMVGPAMMSMGPGMMSGFGVSLTEEQQKKFTELQTRFIKEETKARTDFIQARAGFQALLLEKSTNEKSLEAQAQKMASAQARLIVLRIRTAREKEKLYTKEQREKMIRGSAYGPMRMMGATGMGNPCAAASSRTPMGMR